MNSASGRSAVRAIDFVMPSLGADMESARVVEWLVEPGARVARGDLLVTVETDKGVVDVEGFVDGTLDEILVPAGEEVEVGTVLAHMHGVGDGPTTGSHEPGAPRASGADAAGAPGAAANAAEPAARGHVRAVPRARKLAEERGLDLRTIEGTGPDGVVTADDVERAAGAPTPAAAVACGSMRAAIAAAMSRSKREIPHYYLGHTVDLEPALGWLEEHNAGRPVAERILPVALFVRAVARALRDFPGFCGWYRDGRFEPSPGIHVAVAVALRGGGLVAPAVRDADRGPLDQLFAAIRDVTDRARAGQLRASEFTDGAVTVSSLGDRGVETVFGVIHPPQVALLGFGTVTLRAHVVDGRVVARRVVDVSLSADHRVSDGHEGARFLRAIGRNLQRIETT